MYNVKKFLQFNIETELDEKYFIACALAYFVQNSHFEDPFDFSTHVYRFSEFKIPKEKLVDPRLDSQCKFYERSIFSMLC